MNKHFLFLRHSLLAASLLFCAASGFAQTNLTPVPVTGFNLDVVIENTAVGPPYYNYAMEFNPGEGTAFYQSGLPGTSYGLPASGSFNSVIDNTLFQFQPYTTNNALVLSSETGITSGTLTLVTPATFLSLSLIANSASAAGNSIGSMTINFADGSFFQTNYNCFDWFFNPGFALQGVDRIDLGGGGTQGGPSDPRFYQTTFNCSLLFGATNKPIASLTFNQASGVGATAIYAVSGLLSSQSNNFSLATLTNLPVANISISSATFQGQVLSTGGNVPDVVVYYGTTDGGTNPAAWANSIDVGTQTGAFSQNITGLANGTAYFVTAAAVNYAGAAWAKPSLSFTTTLPAAPVLTNLPATAIGGTLATLQGRVLSTGGLPPQVTIYYGPTDGGTNTAAWAKNVYIGSQSGSFSQGVTGLSTNKSYFFAAQGINSVGTVWAQPSLSFTTGSSNAPATAQAVLTYHNDNTRQGLNANETILTPANVNTNSFGRLFTQPVDGFVYAQPLVMTNVSVVGRGTHDVVFVATEHNSVYAFDAYDNSGANASPLWQVSFLGPGVTTVPNGDVGTTDITPEVGITSTPVIDPVSGTIYVEVKTKENGAYVHRLHALDLTSGAERTDFHSPVVINCTNYPGVGFGDNDGQNPPHVLWDPLKEHSRPALTLLNGAVYMSYASHGDNGPYHGWMFAYNATNVSQQLGVYNSTPNGGLGGFWDGGGGPSVDAQGNLYFQTGNGTFDGGSNITTTNNYAMSVIKLSTTNGLQMVDYFAPANAVALSDGDQDLGSSAPMILPDSAGSAAHPHLVVGGGKTSPVYLMDRENLGRFNGTTGPNLIVQQFNGGPGGDRDTSPAFFNNTLYIIDGNSRIGAYTITNATFNTTPVESPDGYGNKGGATVCLSANGTSNAIAWALYNSGGQSPNTPCVLRAYNATNLSQELYASDQIPSRDAAGDAVKFIAPTIANGRVYVGAQYSLTVYGLAAAFLNTPVISPAGGIFTNSVSVSLADTSLGVTLYYTVDGSAPTTNSAVYTAPFTVTNSLVVSAIAVKAGAINSGIASASFINSADIGTGNGLLGQYWTEHTSASPFSGAPTLVRLDPTVNFNWGTGSPDPSISVDSFTAMWTGAVQPQFNETYTFYTTTDDGVRLWVNGQLLIDEWMDQGPTEWFGTINLVAGQRYNIEMDYYENAGGAEATLSWSSPSTAKAIIPSSQLYPVANPPPSVAITSPTNGTALTATAAVTVSADAAAQYNTLAGVSFYNNGALFATLTNEPFTVTLTGLSAGAYVLTAQAADATGLAATSAPVTLTVHAGSGAPYGLASRNPVNPFLNMPVTVNGALPALLSQTGAFTNTPALGAAGGLIPYNVNVPLWSDGALKTRWLAVPNSGAPYTPGEQISFAPTGEWSFPSGTVFVKHFELVTDYSNPNAAKRRLETRLLVRDNSGAVYGVTYKWRADNSEADLLSAAVTEPIVITNADHTTWTQDWYYPSPGDCLVCHTLAANYVLGVKTRQLNGNFTYPSATTDNQLRTLNHAGLFNPAIDDSQIPGFTFLVAGTNTSAPLADRARSYIDANCSQCHRPGGSGPASFDARYDIPLASQNLINGTLLKGNLGFDHAVVVKPDDIWRSILYQRADTLTANIKMPPLARNVIDTNNMAVLATWINSLPGIPALAPPTITPVAGIYQGSVQAVVQPPDPNAAIRYTVDGSLPTSASALYSGPLVFTNTVTLRANAFESGFTNSVATTVVYTLVPALNFAGRPDLSNGVFQAQLAGLIGKSYLFQASTDLTNWVTLSTNTPATSPFTLADPNAATFPFRFYRAVQLP